MTHWNPLKPDTVNADEKVPNVRLDSEWYGNLGLGSIYEKVQDGRRLDLEDGERLFSCPDAVAVGALAHHARARLHGNAAYYVVNQHINYSNICVNGCRFCAFGRTKDDPLAFELSLEDILEKVRSRLEDPITEIHIVGGCHPDLPFVYYEKLIKSIKALRPRVVIKAFTAVEIAHFAQREGISTRDVLARFKEAGLEMLPGGGAEVFSPRVRGLLCPDKLSGEGWLAVTREAHELGIRTNATMLYGHLETERERLEHLDALRLLQDETRGFNCFIPLPFQPANTRVENARGTTGVEDLKTIAVSRLMLDNIPHIKAYWVMLTVKLAQVALYFGADDLDGTVIEEKIGHMAGAESEQALTRSQLERIIVQGGFEPVERDSHFNPLPRGSL
jgi:aminodeoxyfutalosine synthase